LIVIFPASVLLSAVLDRCETPARLAGVLIERHDAIAGRFRL